VIFQLETLGFLLVMAIFASIIILLWITFSR
jgi:hypothetical protein